jgi:hypothetical protein
VDDAVSRDPNRKGRRGGVSERLAFGLRDGEFEGRVSVVESRDLYVGEPRVQASGADIGFGNGLLSLWVDDPEAC